MQGFRKRFYDIKLRKSTKNSFQFLSGNFHFNTTFCYKFGMLSTWGQRVSDGYGMSTTVYLFSASILGLGTSWCSSTANAEAQQSTVWSVSPRAWRHTDLFCWEWNKRDFEWWLEHASETLQECQVQRQTLRVVWELESPASMPWNLLGWQEQGYTCCISERWASDFTSWVEKLLMWQPPGAMGRDLKAEKHSCPMFGKENEELEINEQQMALPLSGTTLIFSFGHFIKAGQKRKQNL